MNINFEHPWLLLTAIPLLAATIIPFIRMLKKKKGGTRHYVSFALRIFAIIFVVFALAGFTADRNTKKNTVIVVADLSDSTRSVHSEFSEYVKKLNEYCSRDTQIGLVTFGYNSYYEEPVTDELDFTYFETDPTGNYTDIYSAVIRAAALFPNETSKRIIILTDAKENINEVREAATVLASKNIRVDAIIRETGSTSAEVQLTDISAPEVIYNGEKFSITITVESTIEGKANLTLLSNGSPTASQQISLTKGTNRFVFSDVAETSGITTYTAEISTENDTLGKNNKVYTFINVLGSPKFLIVDGTGTESHELANIVSNFGDVYVVSPDGVPTTISELRKYNGVILMNTQKGSLPENWDSLLEIYVRQLGRGLLTIGGNKSYAVGGWQDSVLEQILPVDMTVKDEEKVCDMSLMLVIDNSGSMMGDPLKLAKQGAINAIETVKSIDEVGAIVFSDNAALVSKLVEGSEKKSVQSAISKIGDGGGTMYSAALNLAYEQLKDSKKTLKSVIFVTDGAPGDEDIIYSSKILQKMASAGITVSCIAIGYGAETPILKDMAEITSGEVVSATNINDLPEIMYTQTVKAMTNAYINNVTFYPEVQSYSSVLSGVTGIPELDGYVSTETKPLAYTVLAAENGEPVLAQWQYGLGKAMSFTSDLNGKWSSKLLASDNGLELIKNMISWILPADDDSQGSVTISRKGDKGVITAVSPVTDASYETKAVIVSPSGKETEIILDQSGIGIYSSEFMLEEEGSYVTVVSQKDESGNPVMQKENALAVKYSDEYDMFSSNNGMVAEICSLTGGKADWTSVEEIMKEKMKSQNVILEFTVPLLIISICLMMLDIALRRLDVGLIFAGIMKKTAKKKEKSLGEQTDVQTDDSGVKQKKVKEPVLKKAGKTETYTPGKQENKSSSDAKKDSKKKKDNDNDKKNPPPPTGGSLASLLKEKESMQRKHIK